MIDGFDSSEQPNLKEFPSAQAQDGAPVLDAKPAGPRKNRFLRIFVGALFSVALLVLIAGVAVFLVLSKGPVSNDRLRTSIEAQLSNVLGEGRSARIGDAKFALGKGGLISIDARDVQILENGSVNLGIAGEVRVTVKALPLLRGEVVATKVSLSDAAISVAPFLSARLAKVENDPTTSDNNASPDVDVEGLLNSLYGTLEQVLASVDATGLEEISLSDTKLIGFDELGLRSRSARVLKLSLEKNIRFQTGLFLNGTVEMDHANLEIDGSWRKQDNGNRLFSMRVAGADISEFLGDRASFDKDYFFASAPMVLTIQAPFEMSGKAQQALVAVELGDGRFKISEDHRSRLAGAQFNFRVIPEKNQIELERSPIVFPNAKAVLIGGWRFPDRSVAGAANEMEKNIFELIANDVSSKAMFPEQAAANGAIRLSGWYDRKDKTAHLDDILLKTRSGQLDGRGVMRFAGDTPSLDLDLEIGNLSVDDFKQLWPPFFATGARQWVHKGVKGGEISGAKLTARIPSGIIGNIDKGAKIGADQLTVSLPIIGAVVKTFGDLPVVQNAKGVVRQNGMSTAIDIESGTTAMPGGRKLALSNGALRFDDFSADTIRTDLKMSLVGSASSLAHLGSYKSLGITKQVGISPSDLSGSALAKVSTDFKLGDGGVVSGLDWSADVTLKDVSSKTPIQGRKFANANVRVTAKPGVANIKGTAKIDGVDATVAMVEYFGSNKKAGRSSVTLQLDDAARRKMGIDTGGIMQGPVEVALTQLPDGTQHIDADLRNAKLDLPWIKWSKGKGISATASFDLKFSKGQTRLSNFVLRGQGFQARGTITSDKNGLMVADLKRVRLNKADDFDIKAKRIKGGFDIVVRARYYDGRAIIQTLLNENDSKTAEAGDLKIAVRGRIDNLAGFGGQTLRGVSIDYVQQRGRVQRANIKAVASGGAPTVLTMRPLKAGMQTKVDTSNAGSVLRFLDIYTKVGGGNLSVELVRDKSGFNVGRVDASNFFLLNEPRLGKLLAPPSARGQSSWETASAIRKVAKVDPSKVKIKSVNALVKMGKSFLSIRKGRLRGGDAGAAFDGIVYDQANRTKMKGTFLPAYGLNRVVSKIPLIGLAFGSGKSTGLIGITFKMVGPYKNPELIVNPISLLTPGVFRKLFEF